MPGLQDRVGGSRKGKERQGESFVPVLPWGKESEIKGQRSCSSVEGTKAINLQKGGGGVCFSMSVRKRGSRITVERLQSLEYP